jgi:parvulin-like peptidyl-prolyl cis-trans isomerase-like protein
MKAWFEILTFLLVLCTAGNGAIASEVEQKALASQATGTNKAFNEPQVTVTVPLFATESGAVPLAKVNEEPITIGDLIQALSTAHEERDASKKQRIGMIEYGKVLDRLINVKLVVQEAKRIGLDEIPEFQTAVDDYSTQTLAWLLMHEVTKDAKADPAVVEKMYRERVVEWKIKSLFFEKEDDAKNMLAALKAGKSYEELAEKAVSEKKVKSIEEGSFVKPKDLQPNIAQAIATMETGSVSPIIKVQSGKTTGYTIFKIMDKRYPESPQEREEAERYALRDKQFIIWEEYKTSLLKKYVKINDKVLKGLDYEASIEKFPKMQEDKRTVAEIQGEEPITVGELTEELGRKFWHGVEEAAKSKKLNKDKRPTLIQMISKRVLKKEELMRGIDKSQEFQNGLREFNNSTLFGLFVERVVFPDVKGTEEDLKSYFEAHKKEYQYPAMVKMTSLTFEKKSDAESALKELEKGTDMDWVRTNAEGVLAKSEDDELSSLNGSVLSVNSLPSSLAKIITNAHAGAFRLYEGPMGRFYVLSIEDMQPAKPQPYEEVREPISKKVFDEKLTQSIEDWFRKLRAASTVTVYLVDAGKITGKRP